MLLTAALGVLRGLVVWWTWEWPFRCHAPGVSCPRHSADVTDVWRYAPWDMPEDGMQTYHRCGHQGLVAG